MYICIYIYISWNLFVLCFRPWSFGVIYFYSPCTLAVDTPQLRWMSLRSGGENAKGPGGSDVGFLFKGKVGPFFEG